MRTAIQEAVNRAGGRQRLALKMGVSEAAIGRWLKMGKPPLQRAIAIFRMYGIPLDELLIVEDRRYEYPT